MANVSAPFGLKAVRKIDGSMPNYQANLYAISSSDNTAIFRGDLVKDAGNGFISKALYNSTSHDLLGVFDGCDFFSTAVGRRIWSPYWPGSGALAGTINAYVIVDLDLIFEVQSAGSAAVAITDIQSNATFVAAPAGNTTTGQSTLALDQATIATTSTFPMRIVGLSQRVDNDNTSANNVVEVIFNDQCFKTLTGL